MSNYLKPINEDRARCDNFSCVLILKVFLAKLNHCLMGFGRNRLIWVDGRFVVPIILLRCQCYGCESMTECILRAVAVYELVDTKDEHKVDVLLALVLRPLYLPKSLHLGLTLHDSPVLNKPIPADYSYACSRLKFEDLSFKPA